MASNLRAYFHVFSYLNDYDRSNFLNTSMPRDSGKFNEGKNWKEHYPDFEDDFPPNMIDPLGLPVRITCFLDTDHSGDQLTRGSYSGILIYINRAFICWYRKRQNTV